MSEQEEPPNPRRTVNPTRPMLQALAFASVYLIWGSTYLGIRVAVRSMPPFLMAGARYIVAGGILYAVLRAAGVPAPSRAQWLRAALTGVVMLALGNGLVTWAEQTVPSNFAALLISAVPLYVALLEWLRPGGNRPPAHQVGGILLGAAGMAFLVWPERASLAAPPVSGVIAVLVSGLAWASGTLYTRYSPLHPNPIMTAAQQMLTGSIALLAIGLARGEAAPGMFAAMTRESLLAFVYLTIFGALLAFSAFGWLIKVSTPARLSTTAFVNPVVAVILGWLFLGETLTARAQLGATLIVCAVVVMTVGLRPLRFALRSTLRPLRGIARYNSRLP